MRVKITGQVMELKQEFDENKNRLATVTAMIFQRGERSLVAVKKIPSDMISEGIDVEDLPIRATTYNFNGNFGMSCTYVG